MMQHDNAISQGALIGRPWSARFPGQSMDPQQPGTRLFARSGLRAIGLLPTELSSGLTFRWIGP